MDGLAECFVMNGSRLESLAFCKGIEYAVPYETLCWLDAKMRVRMDCCGRFWVPLFDEMMLELFFLLPITASHASSQNTQLDCTAGYPNIRIR